MNEKIDKLIDFLKLREVNYENYRINTDSGFDVYSRRELREKIRKILGIDKQCFQCSEYCFEYDLSVVEETGNLVCQDCMEGIIGGNIKLKDYDKGQK